MRVKKLIPFAALLAGALLACGDATGPKFPSPDEQEEPPTEQPEQPGIVRG